MRLFAPATLLLSASILDCAAARVGWRRVLLALFAGAVSLLLATPSRAEWVSHGPPGTVLALAIDPASLGTVYLGTDVSGTGDGGVFKTTNAGGSWSAVKTGTLSTLGDVYALAVDATTSPSTVYASSGAGVFKTTDGGANWSAVNTGLSSSYAVKALAVDGTTSPSTVYAGTQYGGAFKTTNAGASWSAVNTGMNVSYVYALAVDATTSPSTVYASSAGSGCSRRRTGARAGAR